MLFILLSFKEVDTDDLGFAVTKGLKVIFQNKH